MYNQPHKSWYFSRSLFCAPRRLVAAILLLQNGRHDTAKKARSLIGGDVRRCGHIMHHVWLRDEEAVLNT